jgi:pimeloyl-ACP methyl ester carboxylesterase
MIIFLHGFNGTELDWVKDKGFGSLYYETLKANPELKSLPVVSISIGGIYVFEDGAPDPYNADLEQMFFNDIIPYFQKMLSVNNKVYLIGHSLGGFNSLSLSLRHPDKISGIAVISPYVAPISPFTDEFDKKGKELKMSDFQVKFLKTLLTGAYVTEKKWFEYNPFKLVESGKSFPYISISDAKNDLPGFEWSIDNFNALLDEKSIRHNYCKSSGDHNTACKDLFYEFLKNISGE